MATTCDAWWPQARRLIALGARRVLLKGGHLAGRRERPTCRRRTAGSCSRPRIDNEEHPRHRLHAVLGTGRAAPATGTAGPPALDAKAWLTGALAAADVLEIGRGHGPVHHFHDVWGRS